MNDLNELHDRIYNVLVDEFAAGIRKVANELLDGMEHDTATTVLANAAVTALAAVLTLAIYYSSSDPNKEPLDEIDPDVLGEVYMRGVKRAQRAILSHSAAN